MGHDLSKEYEEQIYSVFNFFLAKDQETRDWILHSMRENRTPLIKRRENFKHIPPSLVFFVLFVYGDNPITMFWLKSFQKKYTRIGDSWGIDLAFDVCLYILKEILEAPGPTNRLDFEKYLIKDFVTKSLLYKKNKKLLVSHKETKEVRDAYKKKGLKSFQVILEETEPPRLRLNIQEILARQIKFKVF